MVIMNTHLHYTDPFILTIFGASGDLAALKLFPALFALHEQKRLPKQYIIIGYARTQMSTAEFREHFITVVRKNYSGQWSSVQEQYVKEMTEHLEYFTGQYDAEADFTRFATFRSTLGLPIHCVQLFYFSVPPSMYGKIADGISTIHTNTDPIRLLVEKPFGDNEASAKALFDSITAHFSQEQLYLLDHYLGKKPVQSIVGMRHSNRILNTMLRGEELQSIQISAFEAQRVGKRVGYFDSAGILKDMIQSHLLQSLALMVMSIPVKGTAENIRREKAAVLDSIEFIPDPNSVCIGQYDEYRTEHHSVQNSKTPTFIAIKLHINRENWYKVPIVLRTGKSLNERHTFMVAELKKFDFQPEDHEPNRIVIEFAPQQKISIDLVGEGGAHESVQHMTISHPIGCGEDTCLPEHGLLFLDALRGEKKFFLSIHEILACWKIVDSIEAYLATGAVELEMYASGSNGPKGQDRLLATEHSNWYDPHNNLS
jgi:glucose-6-phosphate 1-dehydrogenase